MPSPPALTARRNRSPVPSVAVLCFAVALAACSNRPTPVPSSTSIPSTAPVTGAPIATPAATASPPPSTPSLSTPSTAPAGQTIVGAAIDALAGTTSYRLVLEVRQGRTVDRYEIVVIGPRDAWSASRASTGGTVRAVVIGDRAWVDRGTGAFVPTSIATAEAVVGFDAANGLLATYRDPELANALRFVGREEHDGAPADHYRATTDALRAIRPNVGQTATVDVWIAPDGNLVAISSVGWPSSDDELQVVVSAVDDPANVIRPPG